jgi:hypothetical protein
LLCSCFHFSYFSSLSVLFKGTEIKQNKMSSQENMDEEERMELALNSDFDSALLACWEKSPRHTGGDNINDEVDEHFNGHRLGHSERSDPSGGHRETGNWEVPAASDRFFRLPSFTIEDEAFYQRSTAPSSEKSFSEVHARNTASQPMTQAQQQQWNLRAETSSDSGSSNAVNNVSASETGSASTNRDQQRVPSNASTSSTSSIGQTSSSLASHNTEGPQQSMEPKQVAQSRNSPVQLHPLAFQASANCPPYVPNAAPAPSNYPTQPELMPLAYNAMAAGMSFANPMLFQPQMQPQMQAPSIRLPEMHAPPPLPPPPPNKKSRRKGKATTAKAAAANAPPPFLLFDAPVELRANFMNAQRSHGMPAMQDNNAYHYGMAVNGFHPQDHLNPPMRAISEGGSSTSNNTIRLIDGRHGNQGMKRLKNVKEQKRAQRITDLIEQLREKMEQDGWNVGMKSKFHTLSS